MSHYLAEVLHRTQHGDLASRQKAQTDAAKLILDLWKSRENIPAKSRPFREFESVCEVLNGLNLNTSLPRYFRSQYSLDEEDDELASTNQWLTAIKNVDKSARFLIQFLIDCATEESAASGEEWLGLAGLSGMPVDDASNAIRIILSSPDVPNHRDKASDQLVKVERALAVLDSLAVISDVVRSNLKTRRMSLSAKENGQTRKD